jgi:hypothetical protein
MNVLRALGVLTLLLLGGFIVRSVMHERRVARQPVTTGTKDTL